jgi:hypothetical protein
MLRGEAVEVRSIPCQLRSKLYIQYSLLCEKQLYEKKSYTLYESISQSLSHSPSPSESCKNTKTKMRFRAYLLLVLCLGVYELEAVWLALSLSCTGLGMTFCG